MDDGSCCVDGEQTKHTSTAVVVVFITDVNDNKPVFKDCGTYYPKVEEGAPNSTPVIKVFMESLFSMFIFTLSFESRKQSNSKTS